MVRDPSPSPGRGPRTTAPTDLRPQPSGDNRAAGSGGRVAVGAGSQTVAAAVGSVAGVGALAAGSLRSQSVAVSAVVLRLASVARRAARRGRSSNLLRGRWSGHRTCGLTAGAVVKLDVPRTCGWWWSWWRGWQAIEKCRDGLMGGGVGRRVGGRACSRLGRAGGSPWGSMVKLGVGNGVRTASRRGGPRQSVGFNGQARGWQQGQDRESARWVATESVAMPVDGPVLRSATVSVRCRARGR